MKLLNKVALITGASRGIGRGIAEVFAEEGADVAVNYLASAKAAEDVAAYVRSKGRRAITVQADVPKRAEREPDQGANTMNASEGATRSARSFTRDETAATQRLRDEGVLKLLAIKDSDIRILTLEQCRDAVDKGLHAGGAFSAVIPLVSLFYGGFIDLDVEQPTRRGQDMFVLSKGHAVAPLASIYAELGYFDRAVLRNSRSYTSILNGHPGPLLPGVHISTGPLGQGLSVAQGFALVGKNSPRFDAYCMVGDGELQEGLIWEAVMYSAHKRLDNLCVLVDRNNGQLDIVDRLIFPLPDLEPVFRAFGWQVHSVDATKYRRRPRAPCGSSSTESATASPPRSSAAPPRARADSPTS